VLQIARKLQHSVRASWLALQMTLGLYLPNIQWYTPTSHIWLLAHYNLPTLLKLLHSVTSLKFLQWFKMNERIQCNLSIAFRRKFLQTLKWLKDMKHTKWHNWMMLSFCVRNCFRINWYKINCTFICWWRRWW